MLRPIVMIALFIGCAIWGNSCAVRLKHRTEGVAELLAGVRSVGILMRFQRKPLSELMKQVSLQRECFLWKELAEHLAHHGFNDAWKEVLKTATVKDHRFAALKPQELSVMHDLANALGRSDFASQQRQLKLTESTLEEIYYDASDEQQRRAKICRTLGISIGIACAVLIW